MVVTVSLIFQSVAFAGPYKSDRFPPMNSKIVPVAKSILNYKGPYFTFLGKYQVTEKQYELYFQILKKNGLNVERITLTQLDSGVWLLSNSEGDLKVIN